ncbi:MAG: hypothetical protein LBG80_09470 [Bacteroidales bacterium]|nr:hypothetical protein [Bacteroidales bacterium]
MEISSFFPQDNVNKVEISNKKNDCRFVIFMMRYIRYSIFQNLSARDYYIQ